jgi:archaemetzincin
MFTCQPPLPEQEVVHKKLESFYMLKGDPQYGEWLFEHKETYQSFEEYVKSKPTQADSLHNKIYVAVIGDLSPRQKEIVVKTASYLQTFYNLKTQFIKLSDTTNIYRQSRSNPSTKNLQLSASYLMGVLKKQFPKDAATVIGFTAIDLYPGDNWNYVFGLASLRNRVGVWSMNRFGNPENKEEYQDCLMSTIKTAVHETGHMFTLQHCVKYDCCMNGGNNLAELKRQPVYFCPDCLDKICWNRKESVKDNLLRSRQFWKEESNAELTDFYTKNIIALEKK